MQHVYMSTSAAASAAAALAAATLAAATLAAAALAAAALASLAAATFVCLFVRGKSSKERCVAGCQHFLNFILVQTAASTLSLI